MIFAPLPGEYVASALRRGNETLGINLSTKQEFQYYDIHRAPRERGKYDDKPKIHFPALFSQHDITQEALHENTLFPLAAALGRARSSCKYTPRSNWKICLDCVIEDLHEHGTAYIHRENVLASASSCAKHASRLYERCPTCTETISRHKISDLNTCSRSFPTTQKDKGSPRHLYAKFINGVLCYRGRQLTQVEADSIVHYKLRANNQLGGHPPKLEDFHSAIESKLGIPKTDQWVYYIGMELYSAYAFMAFKEADDYLMAITSGSVRAALHLAFRERNYS